MVTISHIKPGTQIKRFFKLINTKIFFLSLFLCYIHSINSTPTILGCCKTPKTVPKPAYIVKQIIAHIIQHITSIFIM